MRNGEGHEKYEFPQGYGRRADAGRRAGHDAVSGQTGLPPPAGQDVPRRGGHYRGSQRRRGLIKKPEKSAKTACIFFPAVLIY